VLLFSPKGKINQVSPKQIRQKLIELFQEWGMPLSIRVDNGMPLGDPQRKSIPELSLWILSKSIEVIFNRPRQPTDNAKVERMQRTTKNWAVIDQAENIADLEQRLNSAIIIQREKFAVSRLQNRTRLEAYPALLANKRSYDAESFDTKKAYQRLADCSFVRKVSSQGQISLYGQKYSVPKQHKATFVHIKFDPKLIIWKIFDEHNKFILHTQANNLAIFIALLSV